MAHGIPHVVLLDGGYSNVLEFQKESIDFELLRTQMFSEKKIWLAPEAHGFLEGSYKILIKKDIIRKSGVLEWKDTNNDMSQVGGLKELKRWLEQRKDAFSIEAQNFGLPKNPKGILLVGVSGSGKSLLA